MTSHYITSLLDALQQLLDFYPLPATHFNGLYHDNEILWDA